METSYSHLHPAGALRLLQIVGITVLLLTALPSSAQLDPNWLIRDQHYRIQGQNGSTPYASQSVGIDSFTTNGISHPAAPFGHPGEIHQPRRDFFFILENGNYVLYSDATTNSGSSYNFKSDDSHIKYAYVTYAYEDDKPELFDITDINTATSTIDIDDPASGVYQDDRIVHQDMVHGDDITLIAQQGVHQICYTNPNGSTSGVSLEPSPFEVNDPGNTFSPNLSSPVLTQFSNHCISIPPAYMSGPSFYNFRCVIDAPWEGDSIQFTTYSSDGNHSQTVGISSLYHDPNYIQVKCIWKDQQGHHWVRYHAECYNDGSGVVPNGLRMEMTMPDCIEMSSIRMDDYMIGCNTGSGHPLCKTTSNQSLKIKFPSIPFHNAPPTSPTTPVLNGMSGTMDCSFRAWVEFCARVNLNGSTIHNVDLQPSLPTTHFDTTPYPIVHFYDPKVCVKSDMMKTTQWIPTASSSWTTRTINAVYCTSYERPVSSACGECTACQSWLCTIWRKIMAIFG